jgi:hypothetical protein
MKNVIKAAVVAVGIFSFGSLNAQTHREEPVGHKINKTAKKVGHKTSQIAANGAATVVDKRYEGKSGPSGQTVYINKYSHYYYVNKRGHRVYLMKSQLRDKHR